MSGRAEYEVAVQNRAPEPLDMRHEARKQGLSNLIWCVTGAEVGNNSVPHKEANCGKHDVRHYNGFSGTERGHGGRTQDKAFAKGRPAQLTRCCICGEKEKSAKPRERMILHLEDYSKPTDLDHIYPLCTSCSNALHIRFSKPERWHKKMRDNFRKGSWFTLITMDPQSQYRPFSETYPNGLPPPDWPAAEGTME